MQFYPNHTLDKFGYTTLRSWLVQNCISDMAKEQLRQLVPIADKDKIESSLLATNDCKALLESDFTLHLDGFYDLKQFIGPMRTAEYVLAPEHIIQLKEATNAIIQWHKLCKEEEFEFPYVKKIVQQSTPQKAVVAAVQKVFSPNGEVKDKASQALFEIRTALGETKKDLNRVFAQAITKYKSQNYLAETQESIRNGRKVLAVKAEYKRKVKGILHDLSESGQTAYIEPDNAVKLSNALIDLEQEERAEIYKILKQLTTDLAPFYYDFESYHDVLLQLDATRAKAKLALSLKASMPTIIDAPEIELVNAYHPILWKKNESEGKHTVPLELKLNAQQHIIVISGPNAGGKSVALKTVGLLQLMFQSGLLLPAAPNSKMGVFKNLLAEIGDEQSIEDELSTYSARLQDMKYFLKVADKNTLFLIDEFGSGTDPQLGGAIAQSILEELLNRNVKGVVTTHYFNLKAYASDTPGVVNAAMLFDEKTLSPLYAFELGKPGSSYTFAIASKSGLPIKLVERAKELAQDEQVNLDGLLTETQNKQTDLLLKSVELEGKALDIARKDKELSTLKAELKTQKLKYQIHKKEQEIAIAKDVKEKFDEHLKKLNATSNKQKAAQVIREQLKNEMETSLSYIKKSKKIPKKGNSNLSVGDTVLWDGNDELGKIIEIKKGKAVVGFRGVKMTLPLANLEHKPTGIATKARAGKQFDLKRQLNFDYRLDIRGMRADEAQSQLLRYFDDALLANADTLVILHGKGSGVLREIVQQTAAQYGIKNIKHPKAEEGGDGISVITLGDE